CALDQVCRSDCSADGQCPTATQKCLMPDRVCAEPYELDSTGAQLKNIRRPAADSGAPDAAPAADAAPGSCTDHQQNGGETDVDCGGSCPACPLGRTCPAATDFASGQCPDNHSLERPPDTTRCPAQPQSPCINCLWAPAT